MSDESIELLKSGRLSELELIYLIERMLNLEIDESLANNLDGFLRSSDVIVGPLEKLRFIGKVLEKFLKLTSSIDESVKVLDGLLGVIKSNIERERIKFILSKTHRSAIVSRIIRIAMPGI